MARITAGDIPVTGHRCTQPALLVVESPLRGMMFVPGSVSAD